MPSSFIDSVAPITKLLIEQNPKHVIDIGPGWGKYGLLCREYLEQLETLWAVEVPEGCMPVQEAIYDRVLIADVRDLVERCWQSFDLALMVDVIEHMPIEDGHAVLKGIQRSGCAVLVSTPKVFTPQSSDTNPYEAHCCVWTWADFKRHGIIEDVSTIDSIIYLLEPR